VKLALKNDRHQKQALTFMVRREQGWSFREDDLWRIEQDQMGEALCDLIAAAKILTLTSAFSYVNVSTGEQQFEQPQEFRGGIIGDQMGLGKSLSIIALIARDKGDLRHNMLLDSRSDVQSTLIIVRAPRELKSAPYQ
jgi:SNF2 family DNA or RNA helicase